MAVSSRQRSLWRFSRHETLFALIVAAVTVWIATIVLVFGTQPLLGGDFVAFYTSGRFALRGDWAAQYDWPRLYALQSSLAPESSGYYYPQVYQPLAPALYAPFALVPFHAAFVAWLVFSTLVYSSLIALAANAWQRIPRTHTILAALVFPPFVAHQVLGQSTIWPMIGFVGGWWALTRGRPLTAGLILSLVAIKPHLGIALAIVLIANRSWRVIAGIALGCAAQAVSSLVVCGTAVVRTYLQTTLFVVRNPQLFEATDPRHLHALRTSLEQILPAGLAEIGWLLAVVLIAWMTIKAWQRTDDWTLRFATLLLATLLISPHVQTYDAILLAPATLWLTKWASENRRLSVIVGLAVLSIIFLTPTTRVAGVPLTIPLMLWILWESCRGQGMRSRGFGTPATASVTSHPVRRMPATDSRGLSNAGTNDE